MFSRAASTTKRNMPILDHVVIITGGAKGIGLSIAKNALREMALRVIIVDIDDKAARRACRRLNREHGADKVSSVVRDVTDQPENCFKDVLRACNTVTNKRLILVNCAGVHHDAPVKRIVDVNLTAVIKWTEMYYKHILSLGVYGAVLNVASVCGISYHEKDPIFSSCQSAVLLYSRMMGQAVKYIKSRICVIGVRASTGDANSCFRCSASTPRGSLVMMMMNKRRVVNATQVSIGGIAAIKILENEPSGTVWCLNNYDPVSSRTELVLKSCAGCCVL